MVSDLLLPDYHIGRVGLLGVTLLLVALLYVWLLIHRLGTVRSRTSEGLPYGLPERLWYVVASLQLLLLVRNEDGGLLLYRKCICLHGHHGHLVSPSNAAEDDQRDRDEKDYASHDNTRDGTSSQGRIIGVVVVAVV